MSGESWLRAGIYGLMLAILTSSWPVTAGEKPDKSLLCPSKVRVAYYDAGVYYIRDAIGTDRPGWEPEMLEEITKRTGCEFDGQPLPRARTWPELEAGNVDMVMSAVITPDRLKYMRFVLLVDIKNLAFVRKDIREKSLEEFFANPTRMAGLMRGTYTGPSYQKLFEQLKAQNRLVEVDSEEQLFKMLFDHRADLVVNHPFNAEIWLNKYPEQRPLIKSEDWALQDPRLPGGFGFSNKTFSAESVAAWTELVRKMAEDGYWHKVFGRYVPPNPGFRIFDPKSVVQVPAKETTN